MTKRISEEELTPLQSHLTELEERVIEQVHAAMMH